jgi:hypothetical protein
MNVGDLVRLGKWTFYPLQIGQIVEIVDSCTYRILVSGDIRNFADFDYEVINESR